MFKQSNPSDRHTFDAVIEWLVLPRLHSRRERAEVVTLINIHLLMFSPAVFNVPWKMVHHHCQREGTIVYVPTRVCVKGNGIELETFDNHVHLALCVHRLYLFFHSSNLPLGGRNYLSHVTCARVARC